MRYAGYSPMYYNMSFWPTGIISLLINVLIWGIIIYLAIHLIRKMSSHEHTGCCGMHGHDHDEMERNDSSYLDIAKMRYVKGEINKKEYEELKKEFSEDSEEQEQTTEIEPTKEKE